MGLTDSAPDHNGWEPQRLLDGQILVKTCSVSLGFAKLRSCCRFPFDGANTTSYDFRLCPPSRFRFWPGVAKDFGNFVTPMFVHSSGGKQPVFLRVSKNPFDSWPALIAAGHGTPDPRLSVHGLLSI